MIREFRIILCNILQDQLNKFYTWSVNNCLELNIDKCNIISFTRSRNPIIFNYKLNNIKLVRVTVIKDLGIHFESDFSYKFHHKNFLNKSYRMLGFINRNTHNFKQPSSLINFILLARTIFTRVWIHNLVSKPVYILE